MTVFFVALLAITFIVTAPSAASKDIEKPEELVKEALVTSNNFSADPDMTWFRNNIGRET